VTGPDQGFLVSRLVLTLKPWERGWGFPHPLYMPLSKLFYSAIILTKKKFYNNYI
jgi:hypothetical protein